MLPSHTRSGTDLVARGRGLFSEGRLAEAREAFATVLRANPAHAESLIFLSRIAFESGDRATCLDTLEKAAALLPDSPKAQIALAERYRHFGMTDAALAAYDRALAVSAPSDVKARADKAHYLQTLGRFDEAETLFRKLLKRHPDEPELYRVFLAQKRLCKGDPLLRQMLKLWSRKDLPDLARMHLGYALAKAMEETGETDRVFAFLNRANAIQSAAAPMDDDARDREIAAVLTAQDGPIVPEGEVLAPRPVFITGMPRSGTTLVEQIVAAHSTARAGGEMSHALREAYRHFGTGAAMRPIDGDPAARQAFAKAYETMIRRDHGQDAAVVTDKSIQSFLVFGLIHRAMPGARIVVVHRDPRDVALSIYRNHFALGTHRYATDLAAIARELLRFRRVIAHWRERMPGVLHEIRYEDLVADPDPQAHALVAAAGLDWEDACLRFHEGRGAVQTLSLAQVRQPIHAGRREAWRKYETDLHPFIEAWGDEPWD